MDINQELTALKQRNRRVEADKAWETSRTRIISIAVITYLAAALVLYYIGVKNFLQSALIPTGGFILSTQSLPLLKRWWIKNFFKE